MRRPRLLALVCVLVCVLVCALAACGGSKPSATTPPPPGPAETLRKLIAGGAGARGLLTPASRGRAGAGAALAKLAAVPDGAAVQARQLGGGWAVAWTRRQPIVGVALRETGGRWRAELAGPVTLRVLGPEPGETVGSTPQVAAEVKAPAPIVDTALLVDGTPLDSKSGGPTSSFVSVYGVPAGPLGGGRHVAVAFARAGATATATAWPFATRMPG